MPPRGRAEAAVVVCAAVVLACAFTYPYIFNFSNAGRLDTNDGRWSIWVVTWVAHALTTDPLNVYRANIFHPHANSLAFSEGNLVGGAMAIPAWLVTKNPYVAHNFFFLASFVLAGVATYYLVRYLTGDRRAAAVAGVLYAFCPFMFARQAHSQLLTIGFLPLSLLAFHRLQERTTVGRAIALGVVLWLTGLACAYYGIFAGGMVAMGSVMFAVTRSRWRDPRYWAVFALAAVVCLGLTVPLFMPYLEMQRDTGFSRTLAEARVYSAKTGDWLASSAWAHRWWYPYLTPPYTAREPNEVLFPGIVAMLLGLAGLWLGGRRADRPVTMPADPLPSRLERDIVWFYGLAGALAFWISLGPDYGLYALLHNTVPVFSFLRAPARTAIVVTLCLVVLSSVTMIRLMRGPRAAMMAATLLVLATADLYRAPLRMRKARLVPAAHQTLARLPRGPVIELPYWYERPAYPRHAEYMLLSTYHWQPLINGYSDHIPQHFRDTAVPLSSFPSRESFAILERLGARYAVFHLRLMDERTREKTIERIEKDYVNYLRPLDKDGEVWLFEITGWPR